MKIVTVKLPKNPNHNPHAKVTGPCPVNGATCTDVTGEHHTVLITNDASLAALRAKFKHITRIEDTE